ncbi:MAG: glucose-1-phosphate adenylyltransferase subunit GlgD [Bacilli bacterium]|nr:glucose-1-phosphate adenylyltransferase subunit GlgD [Bacilli bacterium]
MKKVIAICNLHKDPELGTLTNQRPLGAVTFLGRYGIMDFALSNFSNSQIDKTFILVKNGLLAIRSHIKGGVIYLNNTKLGFVSLLINEQMVGKDKKNTDLANIKRNLEIDKFDFDYVVIAPSHIVCSMDYRPYIVEHTSSKADISVVYSEIHSNGEQYAGLSSLSLGQNDQIIRTEKNNLKNKNVKLSLESYIISRKALIDLIVLSNHQRKSITLDEIIAKIINKKLMNVHGIKFEGYFIPITSLKNYINYSFELLNYHSRSQLFLDDWPIYSTNHNAPPARYGENANVRNCFIANGSIINGTVTNSILSRDVVIEEGAVVSNSIIFTGGKVGHRSQLKYVVADKKCFVGEYKSISGKQDKFFEINFGEKIK